MLSWQRYIYLKDSARHNKGTMGIPPSPSTPPPLSFYLLNPLQPEYTIECLNPFKPEFTIVIFNHYKPRIAAAILDL